MQSRKLIPFLLMMGALAASALPAQPTIPRADGKTLAGAVVRMPDALAGTGGVLVLGFSRVSQAQVSGWGRRLAADTHNLRDVPFFEMPVLAGAPRILRGMIVNKMASSVPGPEKAHFMPLLENEAAWRAVAHYMKPDDAYVLVVDGTGKVLWQTEGDATDTVYRELIENLAGMIHARNHD